MAQKFMMTMPIIPASWREYDVQDLLMRCSLLITDYSSVFFDAGYMEKPVIYVSNDAFRIEPLLVTPAVAAPMLFAFLIHLMVKYREPPKEPQPKKKEEGGTEHGT